MGQIYRARDTRLERDVALKIKTLNEAPAPTEIDFVLNRSEELKQRVPTRSTR